MAFENFENQEKKNTEYENIFQDIFKRLNHLDKKVQNLGEKIDVCVKKLIQQQKVTVTEERPEE